MYTLSKNEIKTIRSLSQKKFREREGCFVAEGDKLVAEAEASGWETVKIYRTSDIGEEQMSRITLLSTPSPSLAVIRIPERKFTGNIEDGLYLGLDGVRDPGNMGTILRIADWFGIKAVLASPDCVDIYNPKTVQATMGAIFRVPVISTDLKEACRTFRKAGRPVYGTFLDGENIYSRSLDSSGLIIMGNEGSGISDRVSELVTARLNIPSFSIYGEGSESLNVAVATAVVCSEFRRRQ